MYRKFSQIGCVLILTLTVSACNYVDPATMSSKNPGPIIGFWHGLVAPYTVIVRFFYEVSMYAYPNQGLFYDVGYLFGILFSLPIGWLAALASLFPLIF